MADAPAVVAAAPSVAVPAAAEGTPPGAAAVTDAPAVIAAAPSAAMPATAVDAPAATAAAPSAAVPATGGGTPPPTSVQIQQVAVARPDAAILPAVGMNGFVWDGSGSVVPPPLGLGTVTLALGEKRARPSPTQARPQLKLRKVEGGADIADGAGESPMEV